MARASVPRHLDNSVFQGPLLSRGTHRGVRFAFFLDYCQQLQQLLVFLLYNVVRAGCWRVPPLLCLNDDRGFPPSEDGRCGLSSTTSRRSIFSLSFYSSGIRRKHFCFLRVGGGGAAIKAPAAVKMKGDSRIASTALFLEV